MDRRDSLSAGSASSLSSFGSLDSDANPTLEKGEFRNGYRSIPVDDGVGRTIHLIFVFFSSSTTYVDKLSKPLLPSPKHVNLTPQKLPQDLERDGTSLNLPVDLLIAASHLVCRRDAGRDTNNNLMSFPVRAWGIGFGSRRPRGEVKVREDDRWNTRVLSGCVDGWVFVAEFLGGWV